MPAVHSASGLDDHPNVLILPPLALLASATAGLLLHWVLPLRLLSNRALLGPAIGVASAAGVLALSAAIAMKRAGTAIHPTHPSVAVVRDGPYRFTRNPMYVSLCLLQIALGLGLNDVWSLVMVVPLLVVLHFGVILREERYLESKFGDSYRALKRDVRRWV